MHTLWILDPLKFDHFISCHVVSLVAGVTEECMDMDLAMGDSKQPMGERKKKSW